jgi:hypothetical protein
MKILYAIRFLPNKKTNTFENHMKNNLSTKRTCLSFLLLLLSCIGFSPSQKLAACDLCGCGVGGYYVGMLPQWDQHFVGLRYRQISFDSHLGYGRLFETKETFQTAEAFFRLYPHKKIQVLGFIPYQFNTQVTASQTLYLQGLGDMVLTANYEVFKKEHLLKGDSTRTLKQELRLGGGVKLKTGAYRYDENDLESVANPNFQLGTGSYDFLGNLIYTLRWKNTGIQADINYKINTKNSQNYLFGNRLSGNLMLFQVKNFKSFGVMAYAGAYFEHSAHDRLNGLVNPDTGGNLLAGNLGINLYIKQLSLGALCQSPLAQHLARGQVKAHTRWQTQLTFQF